MLAFRGIHRALHRADVAAVNMNADGDAIRQRIADAMNIAIVSGDFLHLACFQKRGGAQRARYAIGIQLVALVFLRAAQHPNGPPHPVIMDRRRLPRSPDEADNREALPGVGMQQILLVMVRMRQGVLFRQPVVVTHQRRQPLRHGVKQRGGLVVFAVQAVYLMNEMA